jgi:hypothetical protein
VLTKNGEPARRRNQANRPATYKKRPADLDNYTCAMNLNIVARKVEILKANNGGVTPYGAISSIVKGMQATLPWLTTQMVRFHIRKLNDAKEKENAAAATPTAGGSSTIGDSTLSTLTSDSGGLDGASIALQEVPVQTEGNNCSGTADTTHIPGTHAADDTNHTLGGRPKGSTPCYTRDVNQRVKLAMAEAATVYRKALTNRKEEIKSGVRDGCINRTCRVRLPKGELTSIIALAKHKYHVEDVKISANTIRSRHKRNKLNPLTTQGTVSPMASFEPYLVEVILQLARMRCPINATAGLHLANSMIEGTSIARYLARWKLKHNVQTRVAPAKMAVRSPNAIGDMDNHTMPVAATTALQCRDSCCCTAVLAGSRGFGQHRRTAATASGQDVGAAGKEASRISIS